MKVSTTWLQNFFDAPLPNAETLADALTFHVAEIEEMTDTYLDVKVLPDRANYLLSHRGVTYELSAILGIPMKQDPLREPIPDYPGTQNLTIEIATEKSARQMGALVHGVTVGPSPAWLKEALESVGQRSINNIVDATNYVTFNMGQPLHAFDAGKIANEDGVLRISVRDSVAGEKVTVLTGEEYELPEGTMVIAEAGSGKALDIAGIKGGMASAIDENTTDLYVSVANFDATAIRKTAQSLKLFTDASARFQNRPSPALVAYGMRDILKLIADIAGGEVEGVVDVYPQPAEILPVAVSHARLNGRLGSSFTEDEVRGVFDRLGFTYTEAEGIYTVLPPFERRDIVIPEDLSEEVGRILGYERIPDTELPGVPSLPKQNQFRGIERIKDFLMERGYTEVSLQSFGAEGDILLTNPLQQDRPWLRSSLIPNMTDALMRAVQVAPRVLGTAPLVKLFEAGTVFTKEGEYFHIALGVSGSGAETVLKDNVATMEQELLQSPGKGRFSLDGLTVEMNLSQDELEALGEGYEPALIPYDSYVPFSVYPFALRDIAVWTPAGTKAETVEVAIRSVAGPLLVRCDSFDSFEKGGRVSYAFRLVFESPDKTLSDTELVPVMEKITDTLNAVEGYAVR